MISAIMLTIMVMPVFADPPQSVGIGGYVKLGNNPIVSGVTVTVKNNDTGEYANTTTVASGLFATSLFASDGDLIVGNITYDGNSCSGSVTVDLGSITQWLNMSLGSNIIADFSYNPSSPEIDETVHFTDKSYSTAVITSWDWDFGDASSSSEKNPSHSYTEDDTYSVTLIVRDNSGNSDSITKNIHVSKSGESPEGEVGIPPLQPPIYPDKPPAPKITEAYTIPDMYRMIGLNNQSANGRIKIAVIDTGTTLRTYNNGIDMNIDMSDIRVYGTPGYVNGLDDHGHGTFTNSEVHWAVENICPNCIQYSIKALDSNGVCSYNEFKEAITIAEKLDVDIISMSFGGMGEHGDILDDEVVRLAKKGIVVVCAAGNSGPSYSTILTPAISKSAIAVGAEDPMHTLDNIGDDKVCEWSSRGPVIGLSEVKPDVVAGGESILGPAMNEEVMWSGTSLSAPVIAGSVAYMMSEHSGKLKVLDILYFWHRGIKPKLVEHSIESSCTQLLSGDQYAYGHGLPDIPDATHTLGQKVLFYIIIMIIVYTILILIIIALVYHIYKKHKSS